MFEAPSQTQPFLRVNGYRNGGGTWHKLPNVCVSTGLPDSTIRLVAMADDAITYRSAVRHGTSAPHCGLAPKALQVVMSNTPPFIIGSSGTLGRLHHGTLPRCPSCGPGRRRDLFDAAVNVIVCRNDAVLPSGDGYANAQFAQCHLPL